MVTRIVAIADQCVKLKTHEEEAHPAAVPRPRSAGPAAPGPDYQARSALPPGGEDDAERRSESPEGGPPGGHRPAGAAQPAGGVPLDPLAPGDALSGGRP